MAGLSTTIDNFYTPEITMKLTDVSMSDQGLIAKFSNDSKTHVYPWLWVRDHCIDSQSLDQETTQRRVDTFSLPADLACMSLEFEPTQQLIHFSWNDNSNTSISAYVLASVVGLTPSQHELIPDAPQVLWSSEFPLQEIPSVKFSEVIESDEGLMKWLKNIHLYGFSLVKGVPPTEEGTSKLALRLGPVHETIFGTMWSLSSDLTEHGDTAYGTGYLEPHTDGTYYNDAAGLQMFNCLEINCEGGESIQLDGFAIAEKIRLEDPQAFQTLSEVIVPGHYIEQGVYLHAERPPFKLDSSGKLIQVSFNNYDRAPMLLEDSELNSFYHAYGLLHKHVTNEDNWLKIKIEPGTTLIFDNWRNMHGRMAFRGKRRFYGCYHSKAIFESRLRVLQSSI